MIPASALASGQSRCAPPALGIALCLRSLVMRCLQSKAWASLGICTACTPTPPTPAWEKTRREESRQMFNALRFSMACPQVRRGDGAADATSALGQSPTAELPTAPGQTRCSLHPPPHTPASTALVMVGITSLKVVPLFRFCTAIFLNISF